MWQTSVQVPLVTHIQLSKPDNALCCLLGCSDEEGSGMADLQRMLQKVVSSKKASARQKQAELIKVSSISTCRAGLPGLLLC